MGATEITIVGVGLLGGSIGLALKASSTRYQITGYGHKRQTLDRAVQITAIDRIAPDLPSAVAKADLVILCTPVGLFTQILTEIAPALRPGTLVTDVGSTKRSIVREAEARLPAHARFVGSHPMAGSEQRGIDFARADLFQKSLCILTPTARTDPAALAQVSDFWKSLGSRLTTLDPAEHDRLLAEVSHLPHALAAALIHIQHDRGIDLCGKGFLDTTRIAAGDAALWRDIFVDNADNMRGAIGRLREELGRLEQLLGASQATPAGKDSGSTSALADWLDQAARRRDQLLQRREMEE